MSAIMNESQKAALQTNWMYLLETVDTDGSLLDHLFQQGTLTAHQMEQVKVPSVSNERVAKLLEILRRKGPDAFPAFQDALRSSDQSHVADRLEQAFQPQQQEDGPMV